MYIYCVWMCFLSTYLNVCKIRNIEESIKIFFNLNWLKNSIIFSQFYSLFTSDHSIFFSAFLLLLPQFLPYNYNFCCNHHMIWFLLWILSSFLFLSILLGQITALQYLRIDWSSDEKDKYEVEYVNMVWKSI